MSYLNLVGQRQLGQYQIGMRRQNEASKKRWGEVEFWIPYATQLGKLCFAIDKVARLAERSYDAGEIGTPLYQKVKRILAYSNKYFENTTRCIEVEKDTYIFDCEDGSDYQATKEALIEAIQKEGVSFNKKPSRMIDLWGGKRMLKVNCNSRETWVCAKLVIRCCKVLITVENRARGHNDPGILKKEIDLLSHITKKVWETARVIQIVCEFARRLLPCKKL